MGGNATPKVPGRSLEHRMFLIFFSPQSKKTAQNCGALELSEGKRHSSVCSCGLWVTSGACVWSWQSDHLTENASPEGTCSRCCRGWKTLFNSGERVHPSEKFGFAFRAKSYLVVWRSFRILIHWRIKAWFLCGKRVYIHTWNPQDSIQQLFCSH